MVRLSQKKLVTIVAFSYRFGKMAKWQNGKLANWQNSELRTAPPIVEKLLNPTNVVNLCCKF